MCFGVLEILMYSGYTHVDYGNGIIWELMFGPEGFWGFIRSLRVFWGGGGGG